MSFKLGHFGFFAANHSSDNEVAQIAMAINQTAILSNNGLAGGAASTYWVSPMIAQLPGQKRQKPPSAAITRRKGRTDFKVTLTHRTRNRSKHLRIHHDSTAESINSQAHA
jgi:hypothetical protein